MMTEILSDIKQKKMSTYTTVPTQQINADHVLATSQDFKRGSNSSTNNATRSFTQLVQHTLRAIKNIHPVIMTVF